MRLLKTAVHPDVNKNSDSIIHRNAARAIVLKNDDILLLYTARYHDYTLPGGGIDDGESVINGLIRELTEETGAQDITNIQEFGLYEEYRPWHKNNAEVMYMQSYCYVCEISGELLATNFEAHEINNGMQPVWKNIYHAIAHNEATMANSNKKGLSIERETFLLKLIVKELIENKSSIQKSQQIAG